MRALWSARYEIAYLLLRGVSGFLLALHGSRKLFGVLGGHMPEQWTQLWWGGVIEFAAGTCIAIGLLTHAVSLVACLTMLVAYVQFHWQFELGAQLLPVKNQGELAVLYCQIFLLTACGGGGRFSVDAWFGPRMAPVPAKPRAPAPWPEPVPAEGALPARASAASQAGLSGSGVTPRPKEPLWEAVAPVDVRPPEPPQRAEGGPVAGAAQAPLPGSKSRESDDDEW